MFKCDYDFPLDIEDLKNLAYDHRDGKISTNQYDAILQLDKEFKTDHINTTINNEAKMESQTNKISMEFTEEEVKLLLDGMDMLIEDINKIKSDSKTVQNQLTTIDHYACELRTKLHDNLYPSGNIAYVSLDKH